MQERRAIRKSKSKNELSGIELNESQSCKIKHSKKAYENARIQSELAAKYGLSTSARSRMRKKKLMALVCFILFLFLLACTVSIVN